MSLVLSRLIDDPPRSGLSPFAASGLSRDEWRQCVADWEGLRFPGRSLIDAGLAIVFAGAVRDGLRAAISTCLVRNVPAPEREGHILAARRFNLSVTSLKRVISGAKWLKLNEIGHILADRQCGIPLLQKVVEVQEHISKLERRSPLGIRPATVTHMSRPQAYTSTHSLQQRERLAVLLGCVRGELFEAAHLHALLHGKVEADDDDYNRVVAAVGGARLDYLPDVPKQEHGSLSHARLRHMGVDNLRQVIRGMFDARDRDVSNYVLLAELRRELNGGLEAHHVANAMRHLRRTGYVTQVARGVHRKTKET